jgi:LysR family glycine cleavage system transcriptional activator
MDVGIRFGFFEQSGLHQTLLFEDALVPLCSPQLLKDVDLSDPNNLKECWLVDANYHADYGWHTWMGLANLQFDPDELKWLRVSNLDVALSAVMSGHGIFLGSVTLAKQFVRAGTLVNPFPQRIEKGMRYSFLYDESSPRVQRVQVFKDWLFKLLQDSSD